MYFCIIHLTCVIAETGKALRLWEDGHYMTGASLNPLSDIVEQSYLSQVRLLDFRL